MALPGAHDPDFTFADLNQVTHFGSSGTLVSDEELTCVSGLLQNQIDNISAVASGVVDGVNIGTGSGVFIKKNVSNELEFRTLIPGSGVTFTPGPSGEIEITSGAGDVTIDQIEPLLDFVASGVVSRLFIDLPLNADDDELNHTTIFGLPVAEMDGIKSTKWNFIAPLGGALGVTFRFTWFPELTSSGQQNLRTTLTQLPSGVDVSSPSTSITDIQLTESWVANQLQIHEMDVSATIPELQVLSLKFERLASSTFAGKQRNISYAVRYKV